MGLSQECPVGEQLDLRGTETTIELFFKGRRHHLARAQLRQAGEVRHHHSAHPVDGNAQLPRTSRDYKAGDQDYVASMAWVAALDLRGTSILRRTICYPRTIDRRFVFAGPLVS